MTDCFLNGYNLLCEPVNYSPTPLPVKIATYCYVYYALKVIDLLDTVSWSNCLGGAAHGRRVQSRE